MKYGGINQIVPGSIMHSEYLIVSSSILHCYSWVTCEISFRCIFL